MGTACPHYQSGLATGHRVVAEAAGALPATRRSGSLPLSLVPVALIWAIYWVPGVPVGVFAALKDLALIYMVAVALLGARKSATAQLYRDRTTVVWLIAIAAATLVGVAWSPTPMRSLRVWARYPMALAIYMALRQVYQEDPRRIARSIQLLAIPVVLAAGYVLLSKLGLAGSAPPLRFVRAYRSDPHLMGLSYRTSGLAWSIAFAAPIMVYYGVRGETWPKRGAWLAAAAASLYVCFLLMNRGGLLAAMLSSSVVAFAVFRKRWQRWLLMLLLVPLLCYGGSRFVSSVILRERSSSWRELLSDRLRSLHVEKLSEKRYRNYQAALTIIGRHPVTGIGFAEADSDFALTSSQAHNLYLSVCLGAGLLAGILVLLFFARVILIWWRAVRKLAQRTLQPFAVVPLAMLVSHLLSTLVESGPMFSSVYFGISFWFALPALEILMKQAGEPQLAPRAGP